MIAGYLIFSDENWVFDRVHTLEIRMYDLRKSDAN